MIEIKAMYFDNEEKYIVTFTGESMKDILSQMREFLGNSNYINIGKQETK